MDRNKIDMASVKEFLKFSVVSISVSVFDIFLYWLFAEYVFLDIAYPLIWSTVLARIISATVNYVINRQVVFQSNEDRRKSAFQFVILSIVQCGLSALLVHGAEAITSGDKVVIKVIVDTLLFFVNYKVQQKFIFIRKEQ